jgi:hypothetical protein
MICPVLLNKANPSASPKAFIKHYLTFSKSFSASALYIPSNILYAVL